MLLQSAYKVGFERELFRPYGIPMQPITLGHVQVLAELEVPFVWANNEIKKQDVAAVVMVCCFPDWQQAREELKNDAHIESVVEAMSRGDDDDFDQVVRFLCYYIDRPKSKGISDPMETRCPWWWSYAEFLQTEMGRSEIEAWNTICADAFCYYACYATRSGSDQFMTTRENYLDEMVKSGKTIKEMFDEGLI